MIIAVPLCVPPLPALYVSLTKSHVVCAGLELAM